MNMRFYSISAALLLLSGAASAGTFEKGEIRPLMSGFDISRYEMGGKDKNVILPKSWKAPQKETTGTPVTVTFTSNHDQSQLRVMGMWAYNENGLTADWMMTDTGSMTLEPGVYDFCCRYSDWTGSYYYTVIREQVDVQENLTLSFDPAEAVNTISFVPLNVNGEELRVNEFGYVVDDEGNWDTQIIKEGNCEGAGFMNSILCESYGMVTGVYLAATGGCYYSFDESACIKINDVSDRYTFVFHAMYVDNNHEFYVLDGQKTGCDASEELKNTPAEYESFTKEYMLDVPAGAASTYIGLCNTYLFVNDSYLSGWEGGGAEIPGPTNISTPYHRANTVTVGGEGYFQQKTLFSPGLGYVHVADSGLTTVGGVLTAPSEYADNQWNMHFTSNGLYQMNLATASSTTGLPNISSYPGLTEFGYTDSQTDLIGGASAPLLCFKVQNTVSWNTFPYFMWDAEYRGFLGELRSIDLEVLKPVVKYGGVKQDVNDYQQLYSYPAVLNASGETELKLLEVELTVPSHDSEGVETSNIAKISMDLSKADYVPPTLRMLQLRDDEQKITNVFTEGKNISLLAIAGDFNFDTSKGTILSEVINADFFIAPCGSDNWTPVEVEADNELSSANFGFFYKGVIANLEKGAYDLKIQLKDLADNTQEQTVRNAFTVKENSGINGIDNVLENEFDVFDLCGRLVISRTTDTSGLPQGVYLLRDSKTGRTIKHIVD